MGQTAFHYESVIDLGLDLFAVGQGAGTSLTGKTAAQVRTILDVLTSVQIAATYAPLSSPALTGVPTAPTAAGGTNTTQIATTQFVTSAVAGVNLSAYMPKSGGIFTGDVGFTDGLYDFGKSGATRPRDGFFSRNVSVGGTLGVTGAATFNSTIQSLSSGTGDYVRIDGPNRQITFFQNGNGSTTLTFTNLQTVLSSGTFSVGAKQGTATAPADKGIASYGSNTGLGLVVSRQDSGTGRSTELQAGIRTAVSEYAELQAWNSALSYVTPLVLQRQGGNVLIGTATNDGVNKLQITGSAKLSGVVFVGSYTVATLPAAGANSGATARVTDSSVAASGNYGATVAGAGANIVRVFSDGTNWVIA